MQAAADDRQSLAGSSLAGSSAWRAAALARIDRILAARSTSLIGGVTATVTGSFVQSRSSKSLAADTSPRFAFSSRDR